MLDLFTDFLHSFLKFMVSSILAVSIYPDPCTRRKGPCLSSNVLDAFPVVLLSYFCAEKIYLTLSVRHVFETSCFRDVMSAGRTVFAYTCAQCVVEIKRTKQYFLISKTLQTIC